ncbi:MAG: hypothetical protein JWP87_1832 [Labilithrix sp.]|nr:hypothetical protein [Labilithrix sp.]
MVPTLFASALVSCPSCEAGRLARAEFFDPQIFGWLAVAAIPIVLIVGVVALVWRRAPLAAAGIMLGTGLGGFVDGILLHQLLQWHNMFSTKVAPNDLVSMKLNMIGDGVFHVLTWLSTAGGIALLWRAVKAREPVLATRTLVGSLAIGWGAFNLLEGLADHQIMSIHHVHPGAGEAAWDVAFLLSGVVLIAGGYLVVRREGREHGFTTPAHAPG